MIFDQVLPRLGIRGSTSIGGASKYKDYVPLLNASGFLNGNILDPAGSYAFNITGHASLDLPLTGGTLTGHVLVTGDHDLTFVNDGDVNLNGGNLTLNGGALRLIGASLSLATVLGDPYLPNLIFNSDGTIVSTGITIGTLTGILKATSGVVGVGATTDDLNQGSTNKYFSNALARLALGAVAPITYNSSTGSIGITATSTNTNSAVVQRDGGGLFASTVSE